MNKTLRNILVFVIIFFAAFFIARLKNEPEIIKREQILLGTVVEIQIRNSDGELAERVMTEAFNEIRRIDELFTTYDESSPVSIINNDKDSILIGINEEIVNLLVKCGSLSAATSNAFDVSIHRLIDLWGFETDNPSVPSDSDLKKALEQSGWQYVKLSDSVIARSKPVQFNFGAAAKGYAVERAMDIIKKKGITEALVNAGGEVKTIGKNWKVGIQHPRDNNRLIAEILLDNYSVATSGDYEQYFEKDGKRYHHIIDPASGYPSANCRSVTVISGNNVTADALATGIFVMGAEKGLKLIESMPGTEVLIVDSEGKMIMSSGFNNYVIKDN